MHTLIHSHTLILVHSYSYTHSLVQDGRVVIQLNMSWCLVVLLMDLINLHVDLSHQSITTSGFLLPPLPSSLSLFRNPLTVSHSYPLSPVRHLPPLPPVSVCIDTDTAMPSSPVPTHALIRAHLPEGQRTIV